MHFQLNSIFILWWDYWAVTPSEVKEHCTCGYISPFVVKALLGAWSSYKSFFICTRNSSGVAKWNGTFVKWPGSSSQPFFCSKKCSLCWPTLQRMCCLLQTRLGALFESFLFLSYPIYILLPELLRKVTRASGGLWCLLYTNKVYDKAPVRKDPTPAQVTNRQFTTEEIQRQ